MKYMYSAVLKVLSPTLPQQSLPQFMTLMAYKCYVKVCATPSSVPAASEDVIVIQKVVAMFFKIEIILQKRDMDEKYGKQCNRSETTQWFRLNNRFSSSEA